jgi:molecular chaperone GrpE (heat shock protein)
MNEDLLDSETKTLDQWEQEVIQEDRNMKVLLVESKQIEMSFKKTEDSSIDKVEGDIERFIINYRLHSRLLKAQQQRLNDEYMRMKNDLKEEREEVQREKEMLKKKELDVEGERKKWDLEL